MPVVHQEFGSVFFRRDRIIVSILDDFQRGNVELDADRRAGVFLDGAGNDYRGFLAEAFSVLENLFRIAFENDALHDPGAVSQLQKDEFAART